MNAKTKTQLNDLAGQEVALSTKSIFMTGTLKPENGMGYYKVVNGYGHATFTASQVIGMSLWAKSIEIDD